MEYLARLATPLALVPQARTLYCILNVFISRETAYGRVCS